MMLWCRGLNSWSLQIQCAPPHHNQVTKKVLLNLTTNSIVLGLNFFLKIVLPLSPYPLGLSLYVDLHGSNNVMNIVLLIIYL